jgi:DNA invertase Pin-like site-specific DNA recombinase
MTTGQVVGYIRVSSVEQNEARQIEGLRQALGRDPDRTFTDKLSGKDRDRPALQEMLAYVRDGDRLIVHSIDRLTRSLGDLEKTVEQLMAKGVTVEFVKENLRFTSTNEDPFATLQRQLLGSFAQFERSIIRERQREGIDLAKRRGVYKGRAPALKGEDKVMLLARAKAGESHAALMTEFRVSKATFYRYLAASNLSAEQPAKPSPA